MTARNICEPGIYEIPEAAYHLDPCPEPSLSNSIAGILLSRSPRHAMTAHPRLNPAHERDEEGRLDIGSAAHQALFEGWDRITIFEGKDWNAKGAKAFRAAARAEGLTPILLKHEKAIRGMLVALREQLAGHEDSDAFSEAGAAEQTVIWQERNGIWCRCRPDWLSIDHRSPVYDYKTSANADPEFWDRQIYSQRYDVQAAFYTRGIAAVRRCKPSPFRFVAQEIEPPYAVSVHQLDPAALAFAEHKVEHAIRVWGECLRSGNWPAYGKRTYHHDAPGYVTARWDEREDREKVDRELLERTRLIQRPMDAA